MTQAAVGPDHRLDCRRLSSVNKSERGEGRGGWGVEEGGERVEGWKAGRWERAREKAMGERGRGEEGGGGGAREKEWVAM